MQQTVWAMDGSFFAQRISGIQRYSIELLAALDAIVPAGLVELVVPPQVKTPAYQNIKVVPFGTRQGLAWQQLDYPCYLKRRSAKGLATCNVIPWFGFTGIAVVHDVCYRARPDFYTDPRGRLSAAWHCLQYRRIAKRAERIITVSEFSKSEIAKYYGVPASKMDVVYNAWQQMQRIAPDESIFARHPQLKPGQYYFSMANLLKNKNFPWVLRAAGAKPDAVFERDGYDVYVRVPITYSQAVLGAEIEVPTVDGKVAQKIPEGTQSGTKFRLRGQGIQYLNGRGRGDQYVIVDVEIPKKLNRTQREALKAFEDSLKDDNYEKRKGFFKNLKDRFTS